MVGYVVSAGRLCRVCACVCACVYACVCGCVCACDICGVVQLWCMFVMNACVSVCTCLAYVKTTTHFSHMHHLPTTHFPNPFPPPMCTPHSTPPTHHSPLLLVFIRHVCRHYWLDVFWPGMCGYAALPAACTSCGECNYGASMEPVFGCVVGCVCECGVLLGVCVSVVGG